MGACNSDLHTESSLTSPQTVDKAQVAPQRDLSDNLINA